VKLFPLTESTSNNNANDTNVSVEVQETATFYNDETVVQHTIDRPLDYNRLLTNSLREQRTHELKDFLSRPVMANVNWTIAQTSATVLATINNPSTLINSVMMSDKMSGFLGFRGTFVLRITLNCQRFMQGRLMVVYVPDIFYLSGDRYNTAVSNLVFASQLPRVEVDAGSQTEAILRVPFIYPYEAYQLNGAKTQLGQFKIFVYSPLVSPTGDTTVPVTYWMHFEDTELMYPTTFTAQSDDVFEAQAVSDDELSAAGLPQPSIIFGRVAKAATILSRVPLLSSVAAPVSWVAGIMSEAAAALGFANPRQSAPVKKMLMQKTPFINNVNAVDNSLSFGFFSDNAVEALPGAFGTDLDEMSISSVAMRSTYFTRFSWVDTAASGTLLYSFLTDPINISQDVSVSDGTVNHTVTLNSPVSYLRQFLLQWRGSMCFTLKFVKTEFHSGRLVIAWFPGLNAAPANLNDSERIYKEVVDVRLNNEFTFCIPYVSVTPWATGSTGVFGIYILNPLRAPTTCAQTIEVLLEGCMGSDAAFAVHKTTTNIPVLGTFAAQFDDVWEAQALGLDDAHCNQVTVGATAMGAKPPDDAITAARFCTGELVTSLRQLMKRATLWYTQAGVSAQPVNFAPFQLYLPLIVAGSPFGIPTFNPDYFTIFSALYAFSRGGVRVKAWDRLGIATTWGARYISTGQAPFVNFNNTAIGQSNALSDAVFTLNSQTGAIELEVPQYTQLKMRANNISSTTSTTQQSELTSSGYLQLLPQFSTGSTTIIFYRQAADDYNCGFFVGALPTTSFTAVGSGIWG